MLSYAVQGCYGQAKSCMHAQMLRLITLARTSTGADEHGLAQQRAVVWSLGRARLCCTPQPGGRCMPQGLAWLAVLQPCGARGQLVTASVRAAVQPCVRA